MHPVHHVQDVIERVYDSGSIIRFLPPDSPDLNPIACRMMHNYIPNCHPVIFVPMHSILAGLNLPLNVKPHHFVASNA